MTTVSLAEAKAKLSALLDRVEQGESIAITRHHRIIAEVRPAGGRKRSHLRPTGLAAGEFIVPDDFDAPLPDEIIAGFEGR